MKVYLRIIAFICAVVVIMTTAVGCSFGGYKGKYKGAYTLIYSQVPDILGARPQGPWLVDPQILLWESDDYGRELYYVEGYSAQKSILKGFGREFCMLLAYLQ